MYFIVEIQNDAYLITKKTTLNEAESEYHRILAAAAISSVATHACIVFDGDGMPLMNYCYKHEAEVTE